jgi:pilus assembly protein CpaE
MGYDRDRTRFVLNRADSRVGISIEDVIAIVGRAPDVEIPSDRDIPVSVNSGTPIVLAKGRSDAAKAFRNLTALYNGGAPTRNGRMRLFGRKA